MLSIKQFLAIFVYAVFASERKGLADKEATLHQCVKTCHI